MTSSCAHPIRILSVFGTRPEAIKKGVLPAIAIALMIGATSHPALAPFQEGNTPTHTFFYISSPHHA